MTRLKVTEAKSGGGARVRLLLLAVAVLLGANCAVSQKQAVKPSEAPAPLQTATKDELVAKFNALAGPLESLNAAVTMKLTAGSAYSGVIEQYHEVNGFIIAARPANIRVIGQAPLVGKNVFDMVSDGKTFHIYIPSKGKFIEGPANLERTAKKPIENLRPQHLIEALLWAPLAPAAPVLVEEANEPAGRFYVLTEIHSENESGGKASGPGAPGQGASTEAPSWEIARKIWFDRAHLEMARIEIYGGRGKLESDAHYSGWDAAGSGKYPREIWLARPANDYELHITIRKFTLNEPIPGDRFVLPQPAGSELVDLAKESKDGQP